MSGLVFAEMVLSSAGEIPTTATTHFSSVQGNGPRVFHLINTNDVHRSTRNNPDGSQVYALDGDDKVWGSDGPDLIWGNDGNDSIFGYAGNDLLRGNDFMMGGDGDDRLYGHLGNDNLWGQNGNDSIICDPGNDRAYGNDGNDYVDGGYGDDVLSGGDGNDRLEYEAGTTTFFGGRGADTFVISREQRNSVIRDFKHSGDRIIVENLRGVQAGWDGRDFSWSRNGETIVTIENMMDLIDNRSLRLAQGGFTIA